MFPVELYGWMKYGNKLTGLIRDYVDGLVITPHVHHKIHTAESYEWSNRWTGLDSGNRDYLLICGSKTLHFVIARLAHINVVDILTYKNPVVSNNGTEITTNGNMSWGYGGPTDTKFYVAPTISDVGALKIEESSFGTKEIAMSIEYEERIISPGQKVLIRITRISGSVDGSIRITGYEVE